MAAWRNLRRSPFAGRSISQREFSPILFCVHHALVFVCGKSHFSSTLSGAFQPGAHDTEIHCIHYRSTDRHRVGRVAFGSYPKGRGRKAMKTELFLAGNELLVQLYLYVLDISNTPMQAIAFLIGI